MRIERDTPIPLHYQLQRLIRQQIESGTLRPGDQLPTEQELCREYQMSRTPVRQALAVLAQEGVIYRRAGVGTFVSERRPGSQVNPELRALFGTKLAGQLLHHARRRWNQNPATPPLTLSTEHCFSGALRQRLNEATARGAAPDLVELDALYLTDYAHAAYLTALPHLGAGWDDLLATELEPGIHQSYTVQNALFGLPVQAEVTGVWLRQDWFAAAGLEPPETWSAFEAALEYFTRPTSRWRFGHHHALAFPGGTSRPTSTLRALLPVIWSAGGTLVTTTGELASPDDAVCAALERLRSLVQQGYIAPESRHADSRLPPRQLARGEVAMTLGGTYDWPILEAASGWSKEEALRTHLSFQPLPSAASASQPTTAIVSSGWCITQQSKAPQLGERLLRSLAEDDELAAPYLASLQLSPFRRVNRHLAESHPWLAPQVALLRAARPLPAWKEQARISRFLQRMFAEILWEERPLRITVRRTFHYLGLLLEK